MSLVQSRNSYSDIAGEKERKPELQTFLRLRSVERTTTSKLWVLRIMQQRLREREAPPREMTPQ